MATPSKPTRPTLTTKGTVTKAATPVAAKTPAPKPVSGITKPASDSPVKPGLRKKELIERVLAKVSVKKKDAKPVIEAMLEVLGNAIENGDDLYLQPMGKLINKRKIDKPNATVTICRLRRRKEVANPAVVNVLK